MEKHIKLVAVLNIAYRCLLILGSIVLFVIAALFNRLMDFIERSGDLHGGEIPREVVDIVPIILVIAGAIMLIISIIGIIGALGLMKKQEWGRIVLIVVSVFNLMHIPIGTALGIYTLWVLLNEDIVRVFNPTLVPQRTSSSA